MKKNDLIYAATTVHVKEPNLLTREDLSQLLLTDTQEKAFELLRNHGWGDASLPENDAYALLLFESNNVWQLMEELMENVQVFHVFRYAHDYNNLKAAIKFVYSGQEDPRDAQRYFMPFGTIDTDLLLAAAQANDFSSLPSPLNMAGKEGYEALAHTGSGQDADILIDAVALKEIFNAGVASKNKLLEEYATVTVDSANIKTAIRGHRMKKSKGFFDIAIPNVGSISIDRLKQTALISEDAIHDFLLGTRYSSGVPDLKHSMAAFERWCDNYLMDQIRPARYMISGIEPLAGFILARQNEISMVRLILSAKANNLDPDHIGERMREMYV